MAEEEAHQAGGGYLHQARQAALSLFTQLGLLIACLLAGSFLMARARETTAGLSPLLPFAGFTALLLGVGVASHLMSRRLSLLQGDLRRFKQAQDLNLAVIESFAMAMDAKDQYPKGHTERVKETAELIGREMGVSSEELEAVKTAALLHDIGKMGVPDYILSKPGKLNEAEMKKVQTHTVVGAAILEPVDFPYPVVPLIRSHHEWYDGSGYPDQLKGEAIPLGARILALADVYDALLSNRPFRPAMSVKEAIAVVKERTGSQFDPDVVEACLRGLAKRGDADHADFIFLAEGALPGVAITRTDQEALLRDIKRANQELFALYDIVQTMGSSLNMQETLSLIMSKTRNIIGFATCVIFLIDPDRGDISASAVSGLRAEQLMNTRMALGEGVSGRMAKKAQPSVVSADASADISLVLRGEELAKCPLRWALVASLQSEQQQPLGTISLYHAADGRFSEDDARLLGMVARQAAIAISNAQSYEQTQRSALTDSLTGLPNARCFFMHLEQELSRSRRERAPLSLLAADVDNLKYINDNFGHQQGDRVLRELGAIFQSQVRDYDLVVRYAGDEFCLVLPKTTHTQALETIARIKQAVVLYRPEVHPGSSIEVEVSIGAATFPGDADQVDSLIAAADSAMYLDKRLNRHKARLRAEEEVRRNAEEQKAAAAPLRKR